VFFNTHTITPLQDISVRRRLFTKSAYTTTGLDSRAMSKDYCKSCTTCSRAKTRAPQTLRTSQATSDSREALEFNLHGFHREAPFIIRYTSILVIVDRLSKQSLFIPTYDTITSPQLHNYSFYTSSPSMVSRATSLPIVEPSLCPISSDLSELHST